MKRDDCILCETVNGVIGPTTVYGDEDFRVILDLSPISPDHVLALPKEHFNDVCQLEETVVRRVLPLAAKIGEVMREMLHCNEFNLIQNDGEAAGQTMEHFYIHVIPKYENSGKKIVTWDPREATQEERKAQGDVTRRALK